MGTGFLNLANVDKYKEVRIAKEGDGSGLMPYPTMEEICLAKLNLWRLGISTKDEEILKTWILLQRIRKWEA